MAIRDDPWPWIAGGLGTIAALTVFALAASRKVVDLTAASRTVRYPDSPRTHPSLRGVNKRTARKPRDIEDIDGVMVHQWGVAQVGKAAHRKVTAHYSVDHDGTVYRVHPVRTWLAHGNGLNGSTVSIEAAGLYGKDSVVPDAVVRGVRQAIALARDDVAAAGGQITKIWAHRQTNDSRAMDPPPDLWRRAAMTSGLLVQPKKTFGDGLPLTPLFLGGTA
jgi:hypothetical protein